MIGKIDSGIQDISSKPQTIKKSVKTSAPVTQEKILRASAATGLPSDKLSASITAFARFFSLSLKPQLLADIRRHALMPQMQTNTTQQAASAQPSLANPSALTDSADAQKSFTDVKTREAPQSIRLAISLAAAAAESKGVELQQKGLESYASAFTEAVDPDRRRHDDDEQRRRRDKDQNEQENAITADNLKKMALHNLEKDPLLDILNKLPGKNGKRWIVIPFEFCEGDREYFVSMRILTDDIQKEFNTDIEPTVRRKILSQSCSFLTLDVLMKKGNEEDRRLFILESSGENLVRVSVCVWQELPSKDQYQLKKEISEVFNIPFERVNIRVSKETFPFEAEFCGSPASVDEAV